MRTNRSSAACLATRGGPSILLATALTLVTGGPAQADEKAQRLAELLKDVDARVVAADEQAAPSGMLQRHVRRRLQAANDQSSADWRQIDSREAWEEFRGPRIAALRASLGSFPETPPPLEVHVTRTLDGEGFQIDNLVFNSRPGIWITANLYRPDPPRAAMPGIVICHSHHTPKTHGELQDMGMTWARLGCLVLVMDQIGHGERRQHGFASAADYPGEFRVSRQDYYFRYDVGIQLHLAGQSLVGQIAWDLRRGVDLLLAREGIDPEKMVVMGAVAGGGDPAAVAAAVDARITAAVPFNFGGPQPETRYPLPDDVETSFHYAGGGSWESTRNLRRSAADGFLPWVIVGGIAPRRLVFAHEFNWDRPRDPVWKRLQTIYGWYDGDERLAFTHGRGELRGRPPEATHCTHIGRFHRRLIHQALARWFDIADGADQEYSQRRDAADLLCLTDELRRQLDMRPLHEVLSDQVRWQLATARVALMDIPPNHPRGVLQTRWRDELGDVDAPRAPRIVQRPPPQPLDELADVERIVLEVEADILVPLIVIVPRQSRRPQRAVTVGLCQAGKQALLAARRDEIARLLATGVTVCLPDVRGTGETRPGDDRERRSAATSLSSSELMLGGTLVAARLRDLRAVLAYLRGRDDVDPRRIGLWGDSLAATNPPDTKLRVPRGAGQRPRQAEPLGGLLAMFGALYEDQVTAVYVRGGLSRFESVLASPFVYIPHDVVVPNALTRSDLDDVAAALAPAWLRIDAPVDGGNRELAPAQARQAYRRALDGYRQAGTARKIAVGEDSAWTVWLAQALREPPQRPRRSR